MKVKQEWQMTDGESLAAAIERFKGVPGVTEYDIIMIDRRWRSLRKTVQNSLAVQGWKYWA